MADHLQNSITRLLKYQRSPAGNTKIFQRWKHNRDLLPKLQGQLEMIVDAYGKFDAVTYDTQGILDDGSDLIVRLEFNNEGTSDLLGFQIKSYGDLQNKNYMQELKAQRDDSFRKVNGLRHYYMLMCTDEAEHKDKIRNIEAEFRNADRTEIIEPSYVLTFLLHPKTRIEALIKRTLEADDFVFKEALNSIDFESPSARALAVFLSIHYVITSRPTITHAEVLEDKHLRRVYEELRVRQQALLETISDESDPEVVEQSNENEELVDGDDEDDASEDYEEDEEYGDDEEDEEPVQLQEFEPQLASDISLLEDDLITTVSTAEEYELNTDQLRPLNAVVLDAMVRNRYDETRLRNYMLFAMGIQI